MMERRTFMAMLTGGIVVAPFAAEAQQAAKVARIGWLSVNNLAGNPQGCEAFRQGLRDLGYVEGRNVVIEYRDAEGKPERFPALARELVTRKVDVIFAPGTPHALAAKQATRTVPIVFADISDPVARGLVTSLARPGGNITGLANLQPELIGKGLELLKQTVPRINHIAFLWQPDVLPEPARRDILQRADVAAKAAGVRLQFVEVRGSEEFDRAFSDMTRARIDTLIVWGGVLFIGERRSIVELAAKNRLPATYSMGEFVDAGGLIAYGAYLRYNWRRAATLVDKILKGAKPGDLPVEQPTKFELVINLKTAKALGVTIP